MGCLVLDGEVEDFLACKAVFEVIISNVGQIDFFLNLQLVIIREVERHRHVGFPHTTFHVVHGKGVGAGLQRCCFLALVLKGDFVTQIRYGFFCARTINRVVAFLDVADIRGVVVVSVGVRAKLQQARSFTVVTANIQCKLTVNVDPDVIIAGEEELDGDVVAIIIFYCTIACQGKLELQLSTKAIVISRSLVFTRPAVEGEEAVGINHLFFPVNLLFYLYRRRVRLQVFGLGFLCILLL